MKFNNNDGASALEESATPPSITICMVEVHIGMILSVLLRILIPFAIVCLSMQTMIDPIQNIFKHAEHPAPRQSSNVSSGNVLQRFLHDSIDNCGDDLISKTFWNSSIHQEPVPASPRPSSRNERGESLPPADNEPTLSALTASASCSSISASTSWIRDVSSLSMTCENSRETNLPADHDKTIAQTARIYSCASANMCAANHGSTISAKITKGWFMRVCNPLHHQKRGAVGENSTKDGSSRIRSYFPSKPTMGQPSTTQQSTFPSAALSSSQSPGLITWVDGELITLRRTKSTSPANENTTSSTTLHEFGLIAQVTTSELISLYVNSPCACTVDVLSGNEYFATLSQMPFTLYNLYWPAGSYTPGGRLASIILSKVLPIVYNEPIEDPSLTVCLTVIAPSAILILDFILSTKTLVCTYDSTTTMPTNLVPVPSHTSSKYHITQNPEVLRRTREKCYGRICPDASVTYDPTNINLKQSLAQKRFPIQTYFLPVNAHNPSHGRPDSTYNNANDTIATKLAAEYTTSDARQQICTDNGNTISYQASSPAPPPFDTLAYHNKEHTNSIPAPPLDQALAYQQLEQLPLSTQNV